MTKNYLIDELKILEQKILFIKGNDEDSLTRLLLTELGEKFTSSELEVILLDEKDRYKDLDDFPLLGAPVIHDHLDHLKALNFTLSQKSSSKHIIVFIHDYEKFKFSNFMSKLIEVKSTIFIATSEHSDGWNVQGREARIQLMPNDQLELQMNGDKRILTYPYADKDRLMGLCEKRGHEQKYNNHLIRYLVKKDEPVEINEDDGKYAAAVEIVLKHRIASASFLQRRLGIGYNRAASLIERMERDGIVSEPKGLRPRKICGINSSNGEQR